jgi:hypothetical protein
MFIVLFGKRPACWVISSVMFVVDEQKCVEYHYDYVSRYAGNGQAQHAIPSFGYSVAASLSQAGPTVSVHGTSIHSVP